MYSVTLQAVEHNAPTRIQLRDHQITPAQILLDALRAPSPDGKQRRVLGVAPVGFGKTVVFSWIAAQYAADGGKVLILAHREELLEQIREKVGLFGLTSGLEKAGSKVDHANLPDVTVASVQSLQRARLKRFDPAAFDLIIVDEAHHATVRGYRSVFDHFSAAAVLGVTGTPKRLDGEAMGKVFQDNPLTIGLDEGIRLGWLCEPEVLNYHIKGYNLDSVRTIAGDYSREDVERELLDSPVLHAAANVVEAVSIGRRTLIFTPTVRYAIELTSELNRRGLSARAVYGDMPKDERKAATADFRAGRVSIAVNCMLWTEGFDVPETDCVILLRPTKSTALMTQMIGRGLRLSEGKTTCHLVQISPDTVTRKLFMTPDKVLVGAPMRAVDERGTYDANGKVAPVPFVAKVIDRIETNVEVSMRRYADLMGRASSQDPDRATPAQLYSAKEWGFNPAKVITRADFQECQRIVTDRQLRGWCTVKVGKKLQSYGLNPNVSFELGQRAMAAIAANKWRCPESLRRDARFARSASNAA